MSYLGSKQASLEGRDGNDLIGNKVITALGLRYDLGKDKGIRSAMMGGGYLTLLKFHSLIEIFFTWL